MLYYLLFASHILAALAAFSTLFSSYKTILSLYALSISIIAGIGLTFATTIRASEVLSHAIIYCVPYIALLYWKKPAINPAHYSYPVASFVLLVFLAIK